MLLKFWTSLWFSGRSFMGKMLGVCDFLPIGRCWGNGGILGISTISLLIPAVWGSPCLALAWAGRASLLRKDSQLHIDCFIPWGGPRTCFRWLHCIFLLPPPLFLHPLSSLHSNCLSEPSLWSSGKIKELDGSLFLTNKKQGHGKDLSLGGPYRVPLSVV